MHRSQEQVSWCTPYVAIHVQQGIIQSMLGCILRRVNVEVALQQTEKIIHTIDDVAR